MHVLKTGRVTDSQHGAVHPYEERAAVPVATVKHERKFPASAGHSLLMHQHAGIRRATLDWRGGGYGPDTCRSRSPIGCTGREFSSCRAVKAAIWSAESSIGVVSTCQATPSVQPGVVRLPL